MRYYKKNRTGAFLKKKDLHFLFPPNCNHPIARQLDRQRLAPSSPLFPVLHQTLPLREEKSKDEMNAVNAMGLEPNEAQSIISQLTFWKQKIEDEIVRSRTPGIRPYQKIMEKFQRRMERRALVFKAAENWKDDREPNSDSDADSIFSDSASTASNESANTTASGATPNEEDEQEQTIYTLKDLEKVIR